jgi:hypothetical protein
MFSSGKNGPAASSSVIEHEQEDFKGKKFFMGSQGKALRTQISIAGALGFLLFGYDQGVLGVSSCLQLRIIVCSSLLLKNNQTGLECLRRFPSPIRLPFIQPPWHHQRYL